MSNKYIEYNTVVSFIAKHTPAAFQWRAAGLGTFLVNITNTPCENVSNNMPSLEGTAGATVIMKS